MPNLSSLIQPNNIVTSDNELTLTNKTIDSPVITVNGQPGNPRQPLVFDDNGSVTFGNGDSFSIPAGGTAARPAAPETGELRYNTDTGGLEQYNGTSWVSVVPDDIDLNTLSINGTQVVDSSGNIDTGSVSINGTQVVDSSGNLTNIGTIKGLDYPSTDGTEGQVLTTDGSGNVSFNDIPAAGGAELVATGTIPSAGTSVALRNDGTVEVVETTLTPEEVGSETIFSSADTEEISAVYDPIASKVVIAYKDTSDDSTYAIVGTVSGTGISFGSPTSFETNINASVSWIATTYDSAAGKVVIAYQEFSVDRGKAIVGTVSGTDISFGSPNEFRFSRVSNISATYDSAAGKVVIAYQDSNDDGVAIVGTVSGTDISFGSETVFANASNAVNISATYDSAAGKVVIAYEDPFDPEASAIVGTVSGTDISFDGTRNTFENQNVNSISATYDSAAGKVVIAYQDSNGDGVAIVGTVSGTDISFGSKVNFNSDGGGINSIGTTYNSVAGKVVIGYHIDAQNNSAVVAGTVSGTNITFDSESIFNVGQYTSYISPTYDSAAGKVVLAYQDYSNSSFGTAITYNPDYTASNANEFIGFAQESASDGDTILVATDRQVDVNQSGLVPKTIYYVDAGGTITQSDTGFPIAGYALNSTTIRTGG